MNIGTLQQGFFLALITKIVRPLLSGVEYPRIFTFTILLALLLASGTTRHAPSTQLAARPDLPVATSAAISRLLGRDDSRYAVVDRADALRADNPVHKLETEFSPSGVRIQTGVDTWTLAFEDYYYGDAGIPAGPPATIVPQSSDNRVEYARDGISEWYVNGPQGLEQGFTVSQPPASTRTSLLTLALTMSGSLHAQLTTGASSLNIQRADGTTILSYGNLWAQDADGQRLTTALAIDGERLLLQVDDQDAKYPLTIDPLVQRAQLTASNGAANDYFSWGASMSADGSTIVVSSVYHKVGSNSKQGQAYVFVKAAGGWSGNLQENARLTASDGQANDYFGGSFGISADGSTIVTGSGWHQNSTGEAYVFVKPGGGWSGDLTETARLRASNGAVNDFFGGSHPSISANAAIIVVGGADHQVGANTQQGEAYVFIKPAGGWSGNHTEQARLTASDGQASDQFGRSEISSDGGTLLIGTYMQRSGASTNLGEAYVFLKPIAGWSGDLQENARLTASDSAPDDRLSLNIAISTDGGTIALASYLHTVGSNIRQGEEYVYVKPGGGWSGSLQENARLTVSDGAAYDYFGTGLALSASGTTIVAGADARMIGGNSLQGEGYVFVSPNAGWAGDLVESERFSGVNGLAHDFFGGTISMSGDGRTILAGLNGHDVGGNSYQGAVDVIERKFGVFLPLLAR